MVLILLGLLVHHMHGHHHSLHLPARRICDAPVPDPLVGNHRMHSHHKAVQKLHSRPTPVLLLRLDGLDASLFLYHHSYP